MEERGRGPEFVHEIVAAPEDIDELGHVSNVVYVRWIQDVARAHSVARGWDTEAYRRVNGIFVVRRHEVEYRAPAFVGDRIVVTTWVEGWAAASTPRMTRIVRADGVELASATTLWVFVTVDTGRPRRIPKEIVDAFVR
jgi:acyl-CoA thioester hydrolase